MYYPCNHKYSRGYNIFKKNVWISQKIADTFHTFGTIIWISRAYQIKWHPFRLLYRLIIKMHVKGNFRNIVGIELFKVAFYYQQTSYLFTIRFFFRNHLKRQKWYLNALNSANMVHWNLTHFIDLILFHQKWFGVSNNYSCNIHAKRDTLLPLQE